MAVSIDTEGRPILGDQMVQLAAAGLVDFLRGQREPLRVILADLIDNGADNSETATMRGLYGALAVLLGEIRAEEVRAVTHALEGVDVNRVRAEHLEDVARHDDEDGSQ